MGGAGACVSLTTDGAPTHGRNPRSWSGIKYSARIIESEEDLTHAAAPETRLNPHLTGLLTDDWHFSGNPQGHRRSKDELNLAKTKVTRTGVADSSFCGEDHGKKTVYELGCQKVAGPMAWGR
jgi:hypothetical protein